jgi:hypothetical protein
LQGLKEARGRVNQLKSSLKHDAVGVKHAEGKRLSGGASVEMNDVDAMLEREKAKLQGSLDEEVGNVDDSNANGDAGGSGMVDVGGRGGDDSHDGDHGEADTTPANMPSAGDDPAVARLKEELMRQKAKYMQAQRAFQAKEESEAEARARANGKKEEEERAIEREIQHYKNARHEIDNALSSSRGGDGSVAVGSSSSSSLGSRGLDSAVQGGVAGVGNRAVGVVPPPPYNVATESSSRATARQHKRGRAVVGGGDSGDAGGIVGAFDNALGDSVEAAKDVGKDKKGKKGTDARAHSLPGIVTDSWWTAPPKETPEELRAKEAAKAAKKAKKRDCHNLYACVGSFFSSGSGSSGKSQDVLHLGEKLQHGKVADSTPEGGGHKRGKNKKSGVGKDAGDDMVSTSAVEQNPQQPLLSALMPSKETHTSKLPGVAENRWGGAKFWSRLLGMPASQAKHNEHRRRMKLSH